MTFDEWLADHGADAANEWWFAMTDDDRIAIFETEGPAMQRFEEYERGQHIDRAERAPKTEREEVGP